MNPFDELEAIAKGELIPGGRSSGKPESKYSSKDVARGKKIEMEHVEGGSYPKDVQERIAEEISRDHLEEHSGYYDEDEGLPAMEERLKKVGKAFRGGDPELLQQKQQEAKEEAEESGDAGESEESEEPDEDAIAAEEEKKEAASEKLASLGKAWPSISVGAQEVSPVDTDEDYDDDSNKDPMREVKNYYHQFRGHQRPFVEPSPLDRREHQHEVWSEALGYKIPLEGNPVFYLRRMALAGDKEGYNQGLKEVFKSSGLDDLFEKAISSRSSAKRVIKTPSVESSESKSSFPKMSPKKVMKHYSDLLVDHHLMSDDDLHHAIKHINHTINTHGSKIDHNTYNKLSFLHEKAANHLIDRKSRSVKSKPVKFGGLKTRSSVGGNVFADDIPGSRHYDHGHPISHHISRRVFGDEVSDSGLGNHIGKMFSITHPDTTETREEDRDLGNYKTNVDNLDLHLGKKYSRAQVTGKIQHKPTGDVVGRFHREFTRDPDGKLTVHHHHLFIDDDHQKKGISSGIMRSAFRSYEKSGVHRVTVPQPAQIGKYTWAKLGFHWGPHGTDHVMKTFPRFLQKKYGVSYSKAQEITKNHADKPWELASLHVDGKPVGKEYLLRNVAEEADRGGPWDYGQGGVMDLHPDNPGYQQMKKYLKIRG